MKIKQFKVEFLEFIPEEIQDGILYVSIPYSTASHKCACGCGQEVVTPFSPTDWKLIYDGESVSLSPSIGNWSYPCRSHYFIRNNRVEWARTMSKGDIEFGRLIDKERKKKYYKNAGCANNVGQPVREKELESASKSDSIFKTIASIFRFRR